MGQHVNAQNDSSSNYVQAVTRYALKIDIY
jgi:hypothetical protein